MENKTPLLLIASLLAFVFPAAYAENVYVYVDPLPPWADYASNVMYLSTEAWKEANPGLEFYQSDNPSSADFTVQWVRDFGGERVGYAYGDQFIEVGLGDSDCGSQWNPYSERHISHIMQHEIGHIFGHGHNDDPNSIMYPIALDLEYGLVEETYRLAEGYGQFVGFCTIKDLTSYWFSISTTDETYGFDYYVVPSLDEFQKWAEGKPFQYYSGSDCFGENWLSISGTCKGVSSDSGIMIIMDSELTTPLETITVQKFEMPDIAYSRAPLGLQSPDFEESEFDGSVPMDKNVGGKMAHPSAYMFMAGGDEITIPYSAGSNSIVTMAVNLDSKSLVIETDVASDGEIVIALPRHLIDAKSADGTDATYIVLVDGVESWVAETADGAARTLTIPVSAGAREIEIFSTQAIPEFGAPGIQDGPVTPSPATDPIPETGATSFQTFRTPEFSIRHPLDWDVDDEVIDLGANPGMWESATSFVVFYDDADDTMLEVVFYEEDDNAINNRGEAYLDRLEDSLRQACQQASYEYEGFECSNYSLTDSQVREGAGGAVYRVTETWTETYGSGDSADYVGLHSSIPVGRNAWMVYSFTASDVFSQHSSVISGMLASFKPTGAVDDGMRDDVVEDKPETHSGGGCLIATAAYGSELAPQVQSLREIRDSTLLSTDSGTSFMTGFNQFYYSFSPAVADLERENVVFRDAVRVTITPALYTLNIMTLADQNSDASVIAFGLLAIAAMAGTYVAGPALTIRAISRRAR